LRKGQRREDDVIVVCNFTPLVRWNYRVGTPLGGTWDEILNSDAPLYGGSGQGNFGGVKAAPVPCHGRPYCLTVTVPPLGMVAFKRKGK
jgi:1,4-alpha-glucan branching enzyme